jgi:hypothetical protein
MTAVALAVLLFVAACGGGGGDGSSSDTTAGAVVTGATASPQKLGGSGPLADVDVYTGLGRNHPEGAITYRQTPPVGGDHNQFPATCGAYDQPVPSRYAVHSIEHGAVWITYRPSLPEVEKGSLQALVADHPYLLVSPWTDDALPSPIVLSAWGLQLRVDSASAPGVAAFIQAFEQGPQAPEPGSACTGVGSPVATATG